MDKDNPIDKDKVAENPGLLPYAHHSGSALVKPEDMGRVKGMAVTAMQQQVDVQMHQLKEQMQVLAKQAKALRIRAEVSEKIYECEMNFEPLIAKTYHLYEKKNMARVLSLIAPAEWGRSFPYNDFIATVHMLADHTWEVIEWNEKWFQRFFGEE